MKHTLKSSLFNYGQIDARTCVPVTVCVLTLPCRTFGKSARSVNSLSIGWMAERCGVAERVSELTEQLLGSLVNQDSASLNIQQPWSVVMATSSMQYRAVFLTLQEKLRWPRRGMLFLCFTKHHKWMIGTNIGIYRVNNRSRYQSITQQYLERYFI